VTERKLSAKLENGINGTEEKGKGLRREGGGEAGGRAK